MSDRIKVADILSYIQDGGSFTIKHTNTNFTSLDTPVGVVDITTSFLLEFLPTLGPLEKAK